MNRIDELFQTKKNNILSVYFTAGYPELHSTEKIIKDLENGGIDMIEIGIPFSDPMADGKTIQNSSQIAINNGFTQKQLFEDIKDIRKSVKIPLLFMGYMNTALSYGFENLCKKAAEIGIDGLIIPDLPYDEYSKDYMGITEKYGLKFILLITPETSETRIREIDNAASGFIYMVSTASTTGAKDKFDSKTIEYFQRVRNMKLKNPTLVGFGISNKGTYQSACENSNGAIIGSAFIKCLGNSANGREAVNELKKKINE